MKRGNRAKPSALARHITVISLPGGRAFLRAGGLVLRCAIGRGGISWRKREGDGATPAGRLHLLDLRVRRDRILPPLTGVPLHTIRRGDGWCDAPDDGRYNRPVRLPASASHEHMWREDHLYDVVGVLDWNVRPRTSNRGSAIFLHLARPGYVPTEGCIALAPNDLRRLLAAVPRPEFLVMAKPRKRRRETIAPSPRRR
jgi:L,D-peptidoglycan transpeptidase YkuD (ErfK/YbiS/YcfS/YnhG family)